MDNTLSKLTAVLSAIAYAVYVFMSMDEPLTDVAPMVMIYLILVAIYYKEER